MAPLPKRLPQLIIKMGCRSDLRREIRSD